MEISPIGQSPDVNEAANLKSKPEAEAEASNNTTSQDGQDVVILSERAKDLAAKKAGQTVDEELSESLTAKQREANQINTK